MSESKKEEQVCPISQAQADLEHSFWQVFEAAALDEQKKENLHDQLNCLRRSLMAFAPKSKQISSIGTLPTAKEEMNALFAQVQCLIALKKKGEVICQLLQSFQNRITFMESKFKDKACSILTAMKDLEEKFWQAHKSAESDAKKDLLRDRLVLLRGNLTEVQNEANPKGWKSSDPKKGETAEKDMDALFAQVQHLAVTQKMNDQSRQAVLLLLNSFTERVTKF